MSYTLAKWALWMISAAAIGGIVGWLLRGLRRPAAEAIVEKSDDSEEMVSRRDCVAQLDALLDERDRLRGVLADCRAMVSDAKAAAPVGHSPAGSVVAPTDEVTAERDRLADVVATQEATIGDLRARLWNHGARIGELQGLVQAHSAGTAPPDPDLAEGARVLGEKVRLNDLTVVEGIGPKIADVLHAAGIRTWWQLHNTDVAAISAVLAAAGPRFQVHDPGTWPHQGGMLARGEWREFKLLADSLAGGQRSR